MNEEEKLDKCKSDATITMVSMFLIAVLYSPMGFYKIAHLIMRWYIGWSDGFFAIAIAFGIGSFYSFLILMVVLSNIHTSKSRIIIYLNIVLIWFLLTIPPFLAQYFYPDRVNTY